MCTGKQARYTQIPNGIKICNNKFNWATSGMYTVPTADRMEHVQHNSNKFSRIRRYRSLRNENMTAGAPGSRLSEARMKRDDNSCSRLCRMKFADVLLVVVHVFASNLPLLAIGRCWRVIGRQIEEIVVGSRQGECFLIRA